MHIIRHMYMIYCIKFSLRSTICIRTVFLCFSGHLLVRYQISKYEQLLDFISVVAKMGFSREAHKMLIGSAVPRLTHIAKSVPKDDASTA